MRSQQNGNITNLHYNDIIGWSEGFSYPQCASQSLRLLSNYGVLAAFVWNSYLSRGGGSQNTVAKTTPLLWLELVLRSPPFSSFLLQSSL